MVDNSVKPLHYSRHKYELESETVPDVKYLLLPDIKQDDAIIVINGFHALKVLCSDYRCTLQGNNDQVKFLHVCSTDIQEGLYICTLVSPATS